MTSEVTDLIAALSNGSMSLDEVAQRFRERSWPRRRKRDPATYLEMAAAAQEDPEPYMPGSFDDVLLPTSEVIYQARSTTRWLDAMAESLRAEDQREG